MPKLEVDQEQAQVMGPAHGKVRPFPGGNLTSNNWGTFEVGFKAHLLGLGLQYILETESTNESTKNAVYGMLIGAIDSSQYIHVKNAKTPYSAWAISKRLPPAEGPKSTSIAAKVQIQQEAEDLYSPLSKMATVADELSEVNARPIDDDGFLTTVCFSVMHIERLENVMEIIMNSDTTLTREALINKLMATEQRYRTIEDRHTTNDS
uniref:Uncharacterized protein n=1 Tax=Spongospora subterranea TaxID=70186 RepID=A0A0H5QNF8_9EUKA|eukprot:CRZ03533.1 hypothetical protein [Spongospora subterranea]